MSRRDNAGRQTQAEGLVAAAQVHATTAYTSIGKRFDLVHSIPFDRWELLLTVAGVFIAATRANQIGLPARERDSLMAVVARDIQAWRPEGIGAFEDCKGYFDRAFDELEAHPAYQQQPQLAGADAVGSWVIGNLVEHAPE